MIYLTAVSDISERSKFNTCVENVPEGYLDRVWGITELSSTTFKRVKEKDWILFYNKGLIVGISEVKETKIDRTLSLKLWGSYSHKFNGQLHWDNILVLANYTALKMPFMEIIAIGNYKDNFSIRRFLCLNQNGSSVITKQFQTEQNYIKSIIKDFSI